MGFGRIVKHIKSAAVSGILLALLYSSVLAQDSANQSASGLETEAEQSTVQSTDEAIELLQAIEHPIESEPATVESLRQSQQKTNQHSTTKQLTEQQTLQPISSPAKDAPVDYSTGDYGSGSVYTYDLGEDTEQQLPHDSKFTPWVQEVSQKEPGTKLELQQVVKKHVTTKKLKDVVPPIPFQSGEADIPEGYIEKLREILDGLRDRINVRLHFVGHTDNQKLHGAAEKKYGDNLILSQERAGTTAEYFSRALELPPEAISYEGMGDSKPLASNDTEAGRAKNRRVEVQVWYDEVTEELVDQEVEVLQQTKRIKICRTETVCKLRFKEGHSRKAKLKNLVPPWHYGDGVSEPPPQFLAQLQQALDNLKFKDNVQMRFIGFTDNTPLNGRDARIYRDHTGLSKAIARRAAQAIQESLGLPSGSVSSTGKGAGYPVASNNSAKGRALNRRIEVEFWHDDPLEELPDEPQICPESSAAETVERIYHPPEGDPKPIYFNNGQPVIPEGYTQSLQSGMHDIRDKGNVRLRFIGYTSDERLDRRTAMVYGDDIGLSTARARRAMEAVQKELNLTDKQTEFEGRGYVQSNDVVNAGFIESDQSKVEVQIVYDELALLDDSEGLQIQRLTREVETKNPYALNLMRISVDGQPLNDPNKNIPDVQRCTDVALDKAQVQFSVDNLQLKPRLNVTAWPNVIGKRFNLSTKAAENRVHFQLYSNYLPVIQKAEVRLFTNEQSPRDEPLAVVVLDEEGYGRWHFTLDQYRNNYSAPRTEYKYVLRVYDKHGNFDQTKAQSLWVVDQLEDDISGKDPKKELLVGYGENRLAVNNIPLKGGSVKVHGNNVPKDHQVWFAGYAVPVNDKGEFASELVLPKGLHTVEVAITDKDGNGNVYLRDLELNKSDWFYMGIADLTIAEDSTNGPAELVTGDQTHYDNDLSIDGRLAFYVKGQFENEWQLTASADTREEPVEDLFSNFMNKSPESVFRRMDPDYYYPTYGDDSTVEQDAPTSGKFYLKLQKDKDYGLWGNFKIGYNDSYLTHVDRALYGANINTEADSATSFGEKRFAINAFAAEPGTVAGRDEFRGTSGSLYYLKHQDIVNGSERLRIEIRDPISGMVMEAKNLMYGTDYDIDYLQGRIMLSEPLSAFANQTTINQTTINQTIVSSESTINNAYLVVRYEYTPGFDDINDVATGARAHYWIGDYLKLGLTSENQDSDAYDTRLDGADITLRKSAGTWLRAEVAQSQGPVSSAQLSNDGGFNFDEASINLTNNNSSNNIYNKANAQRLDASVRLEDISKLMQGKLTFYHQQLEAGYAAPGLIAQRDTKQAGGSLQIQMDSVSSVTFKTDSKAQRDGLKQKAFEMDMEAGVGTHWLYSIGLRYDRREDQSSVVPQTQQQGYRSDAAAKLTYDSRERWRSYGFVQQTIGTSGNRDNNGRVGVGGDYRTTDRFKVNGELSGGDLGTAVTLGTDYKMSDNTNLYNAYTLENERSDNGVKARQGNLSAGFKTRYSDSASVYMEERYSHGDVPTGLTHAMGFDLVATDRLNFGGHLDMGTLTDNDTFAKIKRTAAGLKIGYKFEALTYAGAIEYREDETQQPDTTYATRTTWLTKNSIKYLLNPNWRFLGKLNYSVSESSQGEFYDGNFTEAVAGYAYRPIDHDALNALFKYTYFYNLPSTDQVTLANTGAEYIQKSHILSLDLMYDLTQSWSLGGKYAYRLGQLSQDRVNPQFFDSRASLYVLRTDWHFMHKWDALIEGRMLELPDAGDKRSGALVGIYRHMGAHLKTGIGYNFTDFSDDLTDLDYDSQGFFVNIIGKF